MHSLALSSFPFALTTTPASTGSSSHQGQQPTTAPAPPRLILTTKGINTPELKATFTEMIQEATPAGAEQPTIAVVITAMLAPGQKPKNEQQAMAAKAASEALAAEAAAAAADGAEGDVGSAENSSTASESAAAAAASKTATERAALAAAATVAAEEVVAEAIELWDERCNRLAWHGPDYEMASIFEKVALKKTWPVRPERMLSSGRQSA